MTGLESEPYPKRRVDPMSGVMMLITLAALVGVAWLRFGRSTTPGPSSAVVGAEAPPLRLVDLETSEPIVLLGLNRQVAWVVFWSAATPSGRACLTDLEAATRRLRRRRQFAIVTAAVGDDPAAVRAAIRSSDCKLPAYLAGPETRQRFGAEHADPPLHVLLDVGGRILAMARGAEPPTLSRIAEEALRRLDEIDPGGETGFAATSSPRGIRVATPRPAPTPMHPCEALANLID